MSGGVDSSVAAALLKKEGYKVIGVTMCFNIDSAQSQKPSCCGADAIEEARRVSQILDIPHYVLSFGAQLEKDVIENFVGQYMEGLTPNPCVECNQHIKFGSLLKKIREMGGDYLATGHYARISYNRFNKSFNLKKAKDAKKDQAYFLYKIKKENLPFILFPIGGFTKTKVRKLAQQFRLPSAARKESQDICFIPKGNYQDFIKERLGLKAFTPGPICNEDGKVLGEHKGIAFYTIGQRDGLGIAVGKPVYIYRIEKKENAIYVGSKEKLFDGGLFAKDVNLIGMNFPKKKIEVKIKIRYNQPEVKAWLLAAGKDKIKIEFQKPQWAVTPGQAVVFFRRDVVLGGGTIEQVS